MDHNNLNLNHPKEALILEAAISKNVSDPMEQSSQWDSIIKIYVNAKNPGEIIRVAKTARIKGVLSVSGYVQYLATLNDHNKTRETLEIIHTLELSLREDPRIKLQIARAFIQNKQIEESAALSRELLIINAADTSASGLLILSLTLQKKFDELFSYIASAPPSALLADWAVLAMCTHYHNTPLGSTANLLSAIERIANARAPNEVLWSMRLRRVAGLISNIDQLNLGEESLLDNDLKREFALCLASSPEWTRGKDFYREFSTQDEHPDSKRLSVWNKRYQLLNQSYSQEVFDQPDYKFPDAIFEVVYRSTKTLDYTPIRGRVALINGTMGGGGAEKSTARTFLHLRDHSEFQPELWLYSTNPAFDHNVVLEGLGMIESEDHGVFLLQRNQAREAPFTLLPAPLSTNASAIYEQILARRPEIVHAWEDSVNLEAAFAALLAGVQKIIIHPHNMRADKVHKTKYIGSFRRAYKELLKRPEIQFVSVSHSAATDYRNWIGCNDDKQLNVIYNGFEWQDFPTEKWISDFRANFRASLGLLPETKLIGGIFRFAALKRPLFWINVAYKLAQTNPDIRFVLFGKGDELENIKSYTSRLGLTEKIYFLGYVQTIDSDIFALDALLHTSETEGLPTVIIEAGSAGVRVVSTDVGGVAECTDPENSVLISIEKDCEHFSAALVETLNMPLSYQARYLYATKIRNKFQIQEMLSKLKDLYQH